MADRPLLFSAPMVRALLAGRKTMTRRVAKSERPPIAVGDRVWVRETWAYDPDWDGPGVVHYRATHPDDVCVQGGRWRPSIHMPRWASRITLPVVSVRLERLQAITEADAEAEGVEPLGCECCAYRGFGCTDGPNGPCCPCCADTRVEPYGYSLAFERPWDSINGKRHPWASNPWVWVYGFGTAEVRS